MSNCSNHRKDLFGQTDMKVVAEAIGDLHYETLSELFTQLCKKICYDAEKDFDAGRIGLSKPLYRSVTGLSAARMAIDEAWKISEPFMKQVS